jgi:hypothetical protein
VAAVVFPFKFKRRGAREHLEFKTGVEEQGGGRRVTQKLRAAGELVVRGDILFPNDGGSWSDFKSFWEARFGGFDSFLYPRQDKNEDAQGDAFVAAAAQVDFAASRRYVDTASLVVKKNDVLQVVGVDYTLKNESGGAYVLGTSKKLLVRFGGAPGAGVAVALAYRFYYPMRFEGDDLLDSQDLIGAGFSGAAVANRTVHVEMRETGPGFSYALAPDSL